jgi:hypothetical protein
MRRPLLKATCDKSQVIAFFNFSKEKEIIVPGALVCNQIDLNE